MSKDYTIENIGVGMAVMDAFPVLFFGGSAIVLATLFGSLLFAVGAAMVTLGGASKVLWKLLLAWKKKNVPLLNRSFRYLMIGGGVLMLLSLAVDHGRIVPAALLTGITGMPQVLFFLLGLAGMVLMGVFAKKLDPSQAKSNWIEQTTNLIAQGCIFAGLLIIALR